MHKCTPLTAEFYIFRLKRRAAVFAETIYFIFALCLVLTLSYIHSVSLTLVLFASFLGSAHCAAMCGGFVALCTQQSAPLQSQAAYHIGRLTTYMILGAFAGYFGTTLDSLGEQFGITHVATLVTGILLILAGITGLLKLNVSILKTGFFQRLQTLQRRMLPDRSSVILYPFSIGACSTFLPCGWLYSYVAVAAGRASIPESMLVMFVFWVGTVPVLAMIGSISNVIFSPLAKYAPIIASLLLLLAGAFSIRSHLIATEHCAEHQHEHHHHEATSEG